MGILFIIVRFFIMCSAWSWVWLWTLADSSKESFGLIILIVLTLNELMVFIVYSWGKNKWMQSKTNGFHFLIWFHRCTISLTCIWDMEALVFERLCYERTVKSWFSFLPYWALSLWLFSDHRGSLMWLANVNVQKSVMLKSVILGVMFVTNLSGNGALPMQLFVAKNIFSTVWQKLVLISF